MGRRAAKDATAAFGGAAKDATVLGGEVQSLVPTSSDSMHDGASGVLPTDSEKGMALDGVERGRHRFCTQRRKQRDW